MELTLKRLLEHAEFKVVKGRYDAAEVDAFLDKAAAMAGKVEVQLTQAMDQSKRASGPAPADIEAEVERRVAERVAAMPAPAASGPSEEEVAEEARRTLLMAQRTADAAVKEARDEAEALTASSQEQAATTVADAEARAAQLVADAEARAAQLVADAQAEAAKERREARQALANEIGDLEGTRETLRSDVTVLERHVEEQRTQLGSTLAELQRLLDDPSGFRLAPPPALADPELPDFSDLTEPEPEPQVAAPADVAVADAPPADVAPAADVAPEPEGEAPAADAPEPAAPAEPAEAPPALTFDEVDHEAPGSIEAPDPGPPTAAIDAVEAPLAAPPADAVEDDAFLAELRKAMVDDEPLGPREGETDHGPDSLFGDEGDRRGWRFGRRH